MNKKGFTLIELLSVIVILAIIALIATPIILNIIKDTKKETALISAKFYLDAVENSIVSSLINKVQVQDGTYNVMSNGNMCLGILDNKICNGKELKVKVQGEFPNIGSTVTIMDGKISEISLKYNKQTIIKDNNGKLVYYKNKNEYKLGQEIVFNPGDGDKIWNVIGEDYDTVTLLLNENLGDNVSWHEGASDNSSGPVTALNYLNNLTINWNNVHPISNYSFINNATGSKFVEYDGESGTIPVYGYKKLEIIKGKTKITNENGIDSIDIEGITRARFITLDEIVKIAKELNPNLNEENIKNIFNDNIEFFTNLLPEGFGTSIERIELYLSMFLYNETNEENLILFAMNLNFLKYEFANELGMPSFLYKNLNDYDLIKNNNDYWVLDSYVFDENDRTGRGYNIGTSGTIVFDRNSTYSGIRPVITIPKTKIK